MDMHEFTPIDEIESHRHPILPLSEQFEIVRFQYDFNREVGENTIALTMVHRQSKQRKCLRFAGVTCSHPLSGQIGIYILDTAYRQWDRSAKIEVGEYFEDGGVYFFAESVEEADA
jgi:hypothetical protein